MGVLPFVRTAEEKSFSRAAADLGVTTAAVSKAVSRLEADLGVRLLDRSSRVVSLTRAGEVFLERCRPAVSSVLGAREAMQQAMAEPHGELAITLPFILAPFALPGLSRLAAQYPRLSFRFHLSDRLARLADEKLDVAVRLGDLEDSTLIGRVLRRTRWVTVGAPAYLAHSPAPRRPQDLSAHNCLRFVGPNGKPRDWAFKQGRRAVSLACTGNLLIDHGTYLLGAAEGGMGLCQVLDFMVEAALAEGRLVEVLGAFRAPGPAVHALATPGRASSPNVRALMRFLVEAFSA